MPHPEHHGIKGQAMHEIRENVNYSIIHKENFS